MLLSLSSDVIFFVVTVRVENHGAFSLVCWKNGDIFVTAFLSCGVRLDGGVFALVRATVTATCESNGSSL